MRGNHGEKITALCVTNRDSTWRNLEIGFCNTNHSGCIDSPTKLEDLEMPAVPNPRKRLKSNFAEADGRKIDSLGSKDLPV